MQRDMQRRKTVKNNRATLLVQHTFLVYFFAVVLHDYNVEHPETS